MHYLKRILPYLNPYWEFAATSVVITILTSLVGLLAPWPLTVLIDNVLGNNPLPGRLGILVDKLTVDRVQLLLLAVLSGLLITLTAGGLSVLSEYVNTWLEQRVILDFRADLFRHAERLSVAHTDRVSSMRLMYGINFEAAAAGGLIMALQPLAQSALTLIGMVWISFTIDPILALLSLTVVPFLYYSVGYYSRHIQSRLMNVKGMEADSLSIVHEAMQMLRVVVAFGREQFEYQRFRNQGGRTVEARVKITIQQTLFSLVVNMTTALGTALVLGFGAYHALQGQLTTGQLLVVMSYIGAVYKPLEAISYTIGSLQDKFTGLRMAFNVLDTPAEITDAPNAVRLGRVRGDITFEHVSFGYRGRAGTLKDISFEAKAGQVIALVGPTGAGKTTLISLIPRFYDPEKGCVRLDGIDLHELSLESLRDQVSIVLQEPLLFSGSIADNIRYGRLDATKDEIVQAAKAANAHEFIMRLPNRYDTTVGERGVQLSGGERQRVCVARAFVKNAPILILDEPTSSIDSKTEEVILDALDRLMVGRTTFMIAHRLSTVRHSDLILVLNQGTLVEKGTHEELLQHNGLYKQLHDIQIGQSRKPHRLSSAPERLVLGQSNRAGLETFEVCETSKVCATATAQDQIGVLPIMPEVAPAPETLLVPELALDTGGTVGPANGGEPDPDEPIVVAPTPTAPRKIVLLGMMSRHPEPGVVWQTLHYLLGFKRLGYDPYYVEAHGVTPNRLIQTPDEDSSLKAAAFIGDIMQRFDLSDHWAFHALHADGRTYGLSESQLHDLYREAEVIINLHGGTLPRPEHYETGRLVFLETDPVALQIELFDNRKETIDFLAPHAAFFTFAENYGRPDCQLPVSDRFVFKPTRQPVIVDWWQSKWIPVANLFTTIGNWEQKGRQVTYRGETLSWSKHHEFSKFLDLPRRSRQAFELALSGCSNGDRHLLETHGWQVLPARSISADLETYRTYIQSSRAEFTVAKDQNVRLRTGWFSDRSATYLAAGKPVITQETGFSNILPTGAGLFGFSTMEEILQAVETINSDYERHSRVACEIARQYLHSDLVLTDLLSEIGIHTPAREYHAVQPELPTPAAPGEALVAEDCRVRIAAQLPTQLPVDTVIEFDCTIENLGRAEMATCAPFPVHISYKWLDQYTGLRVAGIEGLRTGLGEPLKPNESRSFRVQVKAPETAGDYVLHLTLVQENVAWFDDLDPDNACADVVQVVPAAPFGDLIAQILDSSEVE
jgi:ABC-type multidrug transport system fused ATPase/permease subunit